MSNKTFKKNLKNKKKYSTRGGRKIKCKKGIPCPKKKPLICLPQDKSKICHLDNLDNLYSQNEINKIIQKIISASPSNYNDLNNLKIECNQSSDCGYDQICEAGICQDIEDRKQVLSYF